MVTILVVFLVAVGALWGTIFALGYSPQLGLDLQGGVSITLIPAPGQGEVDQEVLDQTVTIIRERIDSLGVAEPEISRQGETIQVQLPGVADQEQAEQVIGRTAQLQFRRVLEVIQPGSEGYAEAGRDCGTPARAAPAADSQVVLCEAATAPPVEAGGEPTRIPANQRPKYRMGPVTVAGEQVDDASAQLDQSGFGWETALDFNREGGQAFADMTGTLACEPQGSPLRQLAIVLDGVVEAAPPVAEDVVCEQGITGGSAVITASSEGEARELAIVLRTGALPIQLDFATSQSVSATLGRDSLAAGLQAGFLGLALVGIYLVLLYRGMGLAAVVELAMFGIIVYGLIVVLGETAGFTLTLAGIAGIIVSVGIAADSSIIYRERYRDEIRAGRTIRTAAEHAFSKAWRTNLTGNTVSFLAAVVLYFLAIGPVRGFAFTLGLSTLIDTLLFGTFTRALFGLIARNPKLARSPFVGLRADSFTAPVGGTPR
ncbi:MAG: protein translocase subunit SecD [Egibacteraceae bacterium]